MGKGAKALSKFHRVRWRALRWSDRHHRLEVEKTQPRGLELEKTPPTFTMRFIITALLLSLIAASAAGYTASRLLDSGTAESDPESFQASPEPKGGLY